MKIITKPLNTSYEELRSLIANEDTVVHFKGTDAFMFKSGCYRYIYSKKANLYGSVIYNNQRLSNLLEHYGFNKHYQVDYISDFNYAIDRLNNTAFSKNDMEALNDFRKIIKEAFKEQKYPEYGVELEVESDAYMSTEDKNQIATDYDLIDNFGGDCSVYNGGEIRFKHPTLKGWKLHDIELILNKCKEKGAKTDRGTAGMHIHISRAGIKAITQKFENNLEIMQAILYPINCRKKKMYNGRDVLYGVQGNIYRNQTNEFGTLEIRAWNATLDPKLFLARIKFCKTFTDWLAKTTTVSVESFFDFMNKSEKENYKYMLNHPENPHEWGFPAKAVNALLA